MLCNPYQLVVWRRDGTLVQSVHISDEVAKLTPEQRGDFAKRFPAAERFLSGRYFTYNDSTYLDYSFSVSQTRSATRLGTTCIHIE